MASQLITVKWQHQSRYRRFTLETPYLYANLRKAINEIVKDADNIEVGWRDTDGDDIVIGSDIELDNAINNRQGDVLRIHTLGEEPLSVPSTPVIDSSKFILNKVPQPNKIKPNNEGQQPEAIIHNGITCDGCGMNPVIGVRYKCLTCDDYDLCSLCANKNLHTDTPGHFLLRINDSRDPTWRAHFAWSRHPCGRRVGWAHPRNPFGFHNRRQMQPKQDKAQPAQPEVDEKKQDQDAQNTAAYNEAFKAIFEDVSKLIKDNKEAIVGSGEYLRQIGQAAAEALSQLGIDADIDIEKLNGEHERMTPKKTEENKMKEKGDEEMKEDKGEDNKKGSTAVVEPEPMEQAGRDSPNPQPVSEVEILDDGHWQYVNNGGLYPNAQLASANGNDGTIEAQCLSQLMSMGFANDGGWLEAIVKAKKGDLNQVLNALQRKD